MVGAFSKEIHNTLFARDRSFREFSYKPSVSGSKTILISSTSFFSVTKQMSTLVVEQTEYALLGSSSGS